ncbi:elongation of very long chain fatty acids protein 6-like [Ruditapes philippinarum]|uniref:elongation of very long chain fatty acids protein 6-like n=1 Tax=Ruditapes philippinarum TaxID=129788 RepID=UPI00295B08EC|nr:elongation of very long chain fatty acids protein 6-like [Ruditapes philippinarum]
MDISPRDPSNMTFFTFEKNHDALAFDGFLSRRWTDSFLYCGLYLVIIFGGQHAMKKREKFELRTSLAIWSGLLAVFSIMGSIRMIPELIWALRKHGFEYSYCNGSFLDQGKVTSFWGCLFALSKVAELGDTVFIVCEKATADIPAYVYNNRLQLVQMISALVITVLSYRSLSAGRDCMNNYRNIGWSMIMYFSYLLLFARFFYINYIQRKSADREKKE